MRESRVFVVSAVLVLCLASLHCLCLRAQKISPSLDDESGTVLRIESREAVIDVVARDRRNLPIRDLVASEFEVYETAKHSRKILRPILYLRAIEPEKRDREEHSGGGFHVSSGAVCALDATAHYQIAIQASPEAGFHTVLVKTTRPHVELTFRRGYYVGFTRETVTQKDLQKLVTPSALYEAACYHPLTPPTLAITAGVLDTPGAKSTHYAVQIKPESIRQIGINGAIPRVQLDFGMCVFDNAGDVADYEHATVDHQLNGVDLARLPEHGFKSILEARVKSRLRWRVSQCWIGTQGIWALLMFIGLWQSPIKRARRKRRKSL